MILSTEPFNDIHAPTRLEKALKNTLKVLKATIDDSERAIKQSGKLSEQ